jgi:hypothetical protein
VKKEVALSTVISIILAVVPVVWWVGEHFHRYDNAVVKAHDNYAATQELIAKVARLEEEMETLEMRAGRKMSRPTLNRYDDTVQQKLPDWKKETN